MGVPMLMQVVHCPQIGCSRDAPELLLLLGRGIRGAGELEAGRELAKSVVRSKVEKLWILRAQEGGEFETLSRSALTGSGNGAMDD